MVERELYDVECRRQEWDDERRINARLHQAGRYFEECLGKMEVGGGSDREERDRWSAPCRRM